MEDNNDKITDLSVPEEVKQADIDLITQIVGESDTEKLKDLTNLFNAFQVKRNILRVNALNDVQDRLVQQMRDRLDKFPDNFSNGDIALWAKTVQSALDSTQGKIKEVESMPTIVHQNNTQVNINVEDSLNRESRERILNALQLILSSNSGDNESTDLLTDESIDMEENSSEDVSDDK